MPATKEFTVLMEDRPSTLGRFCRALADREVNILALQSFPIGGKSVTRFIVDNPSTAKTVLDSEQLTYVEAEIVQAKLLHRSGEIANSIPFGGGQHQHQLRILRLGARYEHASRFFWRHGS
jgi:hypothetical protein